MKVPILLLVCTTLLLAQSSGLTPREAVDGWIQLFDGESSFGWTPEGGAHWRVFDGAVIAEGGESGWLRTDVMFADFVLKCEFRAVAEMDSGLFLRAAAEGNPGTTGYELQIWNEGPKYPTGSLVDLARAKHATFKPDQWNSYEVTVEGDHFVVLLNGKKILDTHNGRRRMGYIGLQYNQGNPVAFRNLKLKPLGLKPIFNSRDLSGWEVVASARAKVPAEWSVRDGAIHVEKGTGQLETISLHRDFVLQMDIRANAPDAEHHPNSGVFFRGDSQRFATGYESQILNEYRDQDRTKPVDFGTGAIYNRVAARRVVSSDNEYFTKTVIANGRHLAVWVNGYSVTDWDDPRPEGTNARKEARLKEGPISLQAHDPTTNIDFKNIRIAELPR
jgi:hypothetical protein